ncbi:hypothetical protein ARTHRO9V_160057 [Arthrobacter sp. 9V]|nr:hypothetical protein ARTHRO9V_160057 [Arthrobacter sp. 9V]
MIDGEATGGDEIFDPEGPSFLLTVQSSGRALTFMLLRDLTPRS